MEYILGFILWVALWFLARRFISKRNGWIVLGWIVGIYWFHILIKPYRMQRILFDLGLM